MQRPKFITVTAPEGRLTPIHERDGINPNGGQLRVEHGEVARVRYSQTTERAITDGDLLPCDMDGALVDSVHLADSPTDIGPKFRPARCVAPPSPSAAEEVHPVLTPSLEETVAAIAEAPYSSVDKLEDSPRPAPTVQPAKEE